MPQPENAIRFSPAVTDARPRVVYLAACVSRAMGPAVGDKEQMSQYDKTRQLLEKNNAITALLCHSPDAMIGCLSGIHQVGRTVGKDVFLTQQVALVGFEDMMHVNLTSPSFTYVSSASEETGRQVASLIIRKIKEPALPTQRITLSGQLVARESA